MEIDNAMYARASYDWWGDPENSTNTLLRRFVNPIRFRYFSRVLVEHGAAAVRGRRILDVGSGGGFLAEDFAAAGLEVTGVDPARHSVVCAAAHAAEAGLAIEYVEGRAEALPFGANAFDYVACCDVLEHVAEVGAAVGEIARVLRPRGVFFFDTVNRTLASYLIAIKVAQDWKLTAFEAPRTHAWRKFVTPRELAAVMAIKGLRQREVRGIAASAGMLRSLWSVRRRARGEISRYEMGLQLAMRESDDLRVSYMGYAVKDCVA